MRASRITAGGVVATGLAIGVVLLVNRGGPSMSVPRFVDESASSGVNHVYDGEFDYFVGGGVATFDCSSDGFPDLYLAGGSRPASLFVNHSEQGGPLRFEALPSPTTDLDAVTGAYPIDLNSDDIDDLVVLRHRDSRILLGDGGCRFHDATADLGVQLADDWSVAFSATWEDDQLFPTLAFGGYLVPDTYDCDENTLWRPNGDRYTDAIRLPGHCTLSLLFSDWNRDGHADLRVSNDRNYDRDAREQLWRIRPSEQPREYTSTDGWQDLTIWGMGIASHDIDGDGQPEVFLTSQGDNKLQALVPDAKGPQYADIALERGATAQRPYTGDDILPSTAWHPQFADVNNDGRVDLFISKGNVDAQIDYAAVDPNNLLLAQRDGTFVEHGKDAGVADTARSRGAAVVDLNLDGLLDLIVVNRREPAEIRRNMGGGSTDARAQMGHWLQITVRQPAPNTRAVGAWVEVRHDGQTQYTEITVGGGHASGQSGWIHMGLGTSSTAEVRVVYPDGTVGAWSTVAADRFYVIDRTEPKPVEWTITQQMPASAP